MYDIIHKINERKDYEAQLLECTKPILLDDVPAPEILSFVPDKFENPIQEYFFWYEKFILFFEYVVIPLIRINNLIQKKHIYPILFEEDYDSADIIPCSYSEAFQFFQELSIPDIKEVLQKWATSIEYVNLLDVIERCNYEEFVKIFSNINDVCGKLKKINECRHLWPMMKLTSNLLDSISNGNVNNFNIHFNKINEISNSYNWSELDGVCCFLEESFSDAFPKIKVLTQWLKTGPYYKEIYKTLYYPCFNSTDIKEKEDYKRANKLHERWGCSRKFIHFWRYIASVFYVIFMEGAKQIELSSPERKVLESIKSDNEGIILLMRPNIMERFFQRWENKLCAYENGVIEPQEVLSTSLQMIMLKGNPYFDEAKKKGLIKQDGGKLVWTESTVLLAYFCGRIYCGDYIKEPKEEYRVPEWVSGGRPFPDKELSTIFNKKHIAQSRRSRINESRTPKDYQKIDIIFNYVFCRLQN